MENREYWSGTKIDKLDKNEIFVYGANPSGIHGAGGAKSAMSFGAKMTVGRGLMGSTYGLITKNLEGKEGFVEKATGIVYDKAGFRSVSPEMIHANILELYACARENPDKRFLITYQYETWPNGSPKKSLNGYTSQELLEMFVTDNIPSNIIFHDSYKTHLEKILTKTMNNQKQENNKKVEYTYFFHLTSPFSNFHPAKFTYKDYTFISNEQFMMFTKAKTFGDEETANKIMNIWNEFMIEPGVFKDEQQKLCFQLSGAFQRGEITRQKILANKDYVEAWNTIHKKIKQLGREVKNYDDKVWDDKRFKVVCIGAREKFGQNADLKEILMNTGETLMCEASPYDKIWGCGLSASDAKKTPPEKWPGLNLLGDVLTQLKDYFRNENTPSTKMKM